MRFTFWTDLIHDFTDFSDDLLICFLRSLLCSNFRRFFLHWPPDQGVDMVLDVQPISNVHPVAIKGCFLIVLLLITTGISFSGYCHGP